MGSKFYQAPFYCPHCNAVLYYTNLTKRLFCRDCREYIDLKKDKPMRTVLYHGRPVHIKKVLENEE